MSVMVGDGRVVAQKVSRSITYYYLSQRSGDRTLSPTKPSPSPSPPIISTSSLSPSSLRDPPAGSQTYPLLSDLPSLPSVSVPLTPSPSSSSSSPRPLLLLFPWFGARPGSVAKYRNLYLGRGMDILSVESSVLHFLWPRWGLEYGREVLEVLRDQRFTGRPLLVKCFSIGGYTFTQLLIHMAREPEKYPGLAQRVKGHIYDSMVAGSLEHMAAGLGKTIFPRLEWLVKNVAMLYFWLFKKQTADYYNDGIQLFYNSPVTAPALFFFCENDAMCDPVAMEDLIDFWRKRGVAVETTKWKESIHAAHLRCHPEEYLSTLDKFLDSLTIAPLRAKM